MKITDLIPWSGTGRDVGPQTGPVDPLRALRQDIDRAFEQFWRMLPSPFPEFAPSAPDSVRLDVSDSDKAITVTAELPGLSEDDIELSISEGSLTIRGERSTDRKTEDGGLIVRERAYGSFQRTLQLPDGVDADAASATFKNGILTIEVPKTVESIPSIQRIPVQAG